MCECDVREVYRQLSALVEGILKYCFELITVYGKELPR